MEYKLFKDASFFSFLACERNSKRQYRKASYFIRKLEEDISVVALQKYLAVVSFDK